MRSNDYLLLLGAFGISITIGGICPPASAAGPEIYSAMEGETLVSLEPTLPATIPTTESAPKITKNSKKNITQKKLTLRQRIEALEREITALRAEKLQQEQGSADRFGFDTVPPEHAPQIAERLKLVQIMILRYGRAYDYRQMTLPELKNVFAQLEREKE